MTWTKLVGFFKETVPATIKNVIVPFTLRALGVAGGFWGWLVGVVMTSIWDIVEKQAESAARVQDQKNIDDPNIEKYKEDIAKGAPVDELIKDETNLLNGTKPK